MGIGDDAPFSVVLDGARVPRRYRGRLYDRLQLVVTASRCRSWSAAPKTSIGIPGEPSTEPSTEGEAHAEKEAQDKEAKEKETKEVKENEAKEAKAKGRGVC